MPSNPQYTPGVGVSLPVAHIPLPSEKAAAADVTALTTAVAGKVLRIAGLKAARPTLANVAADKGYQYFATDHAVNGAPLWWNGTAWVDATGGIVA
jgi:hypothetical protein